MKVNPSALALGQQICIPSTSAGSYNIGGSSSIGTITTGCTYYTIKSGKLKANLKKSDGSYLRIFFRF